MKKLLVVLLADRSSHENAGRATHALLYAKQANEAKLTSKLIFDGGGTEWALEMTKELSHYHSLYKKLTEKGVILGVCRFCSKAFGIEDELKKVDASFIDEDQGHPNIGRYIAEGWQVITL